MIFKKNLKNREKITIANNHYTLPIVIFCQKPYYGVLFFYFRIIKCQIIGHQTLTNHKNQQNQQPIHNPIHQQIPSQYAGKEWQLLEKTLMASIQEQRRARRWSVFFKLLTFGYIIVVGSLMARSCQQTDGNPKALTASVTEPQFGCGGG